MTIKTFESKLVEYYGSPANDFVRDTTMLYVSKTYEEKSLGILISGIMKSHPTSWGFPDIAAIEKAHDKMGKEKFPVNVKKSGDRNYWMDDLSISDEEWKKGFNGLEKLKKVVKVGIEKAEQKHVNKLDPISLQQAKEELKAMCKDKGEVMEELK